MSDVFERVGALVRDGQVVNSILWADCTYDQLANDGYEHLEETTDMPTQPGIGWSWSSTDGFVAPRPTYFSKDGEDVPLLSWLWNKKTMTWEAPKPMPASTDKDNPEPYDWDEESLSWVVPQWWLDEQSEQQEDQGE